MPSRKRIGLVESKIGVAQMDLHDIVNHYVSPISCFFPFNQENLCLCFNGEVLLWCFHSIWYLCKISLAFSVHWSL